MKRKNDSPFKTPDHYFDSIEDRVMATIKHQEKNTTKSSKVIQFLKPALGLVASFTLVYLLVFYPINHFLPKTVAKSEISDTITKDLLEDYSLSFSLIDENTILNTISADEDESSSEIGSEDMLAYLSTEFNDLQIYDEIQN